MGVADGLGDFLVGTGLPVRDSPGGFQHLGLKFRTVDFYGNGEILDFPVQVEVQLTPGLLVYLGVSAPSFSLGFWFGVGAGLETAGRLASSERESAELDPVKNKNPFPPHISVVDLGKFGILEIHTINIYPYCPGVQKRQLSWLRFCYIMPVKIFNKDK